MTKLAHIFHSGLISGPEKLIIPVVPQTFEEFTLIWLEETRLSDEAKQKVLDFFSRHCKDVIQIKVTKRFDTESIEALSRLVQEKNFDIVHAHDVKASIYAHWALKKIPADHRPRFYSTHHGIDARSGFMNRAYEKVYRYTSLSHADMALTVCERDRQLLEDTNVISTQTLACHSNGISPDHKHVFYSREKVRAEWQISPSTFTIGVIARFSAEKRHSLALKAAQYLAEKYKNFRVLLFGSGPLAEEISSQISQLNLESFVTLKSYDPLISSKLKGFDLILSVSSGEGIPLNLIEAGWAHVPCMATDVGGVKELLNYGKAGFLIHAKISAMEIGRKLEDIMTLPQTSLQYVGNAFGDHVMHHFSAEQWLQDLQKFYKKSLKKDPYHAEF